MQKLEQLYLTSTAKRPVHIIRYPSNELAPIKSTPTNFYSPLFHMRAHKLTPALLKTSPVIKEGMANVYITNNAPKKIWRTKLINKKRDIFNQTLGLVSEPSVLYVYSLNDNCNIAESDEFLINEITKSVYSSGHCESVNKKVSDTLMPFKSIKHPKIKNKAENYIYVYCLVKNDIEVGMAAKALSKAIELLTDNSKLYDVILNKTENFKQKHAYLRKILNRFELPDDIYRYVVRYFSDETALNFNDVLLLLKELQDGLIKYNSRYLLR